MAKSKIYHWKRGEPLHPARAPLSQLDRRKLELGSIDFSAQYLQAPMPPEGGMLKGRWLKDVEAVPARQSCDRIYQSWDTALKANENNDYSAGLTLLVRGPNEIYLTDVVRERMEFPELKTRVIHLAQAASPTALLIEDHGSGTALIQYAKMAVSGVIAIAHQADKPTRMQGATPILEGGALHLPKNAPWRDDFLEEYLAFPNGRYDDQIDALSQFLNWHRDHRPSTFEVFWT